MSVATRGESMVCRDDAKNAITIEARGVAALFEASFEAALRSQEAPLACKAINGLLAMTMLANANRLNSCASFLAMPL